MGAYVLPRQPDLQRMRGKPLLIQTDYWEQQMPNGWTPERRARQAELIKVWRPWEHSTGPKTAAGKAAVARNAWRGGTRQMLREMSRALAEHRELLKAA